MSLLFKHILINRPVDNEVIPSFSMFEIVFLLKPNIKLKVDAGILIFFTTERGEPQIEI